MIRPLLIVVAFFSFTLPVVAQHSVITQGRDQLVRLSAEGEVLWRMPWGPIHDIHVLTNGHVMVQRGSSSVVEIDPATQHVVWEYDASQSNGNAGKRVEVHAFQPLADWPSDDGRLLIAESGPARLIEIDHVGNIVHQVQLQVDKPDPHRDTRLVRKLASGNYLVCHEADGKIREYEGATGKVVWEFAVPMFDQEARPGHGPDAFGNAVFGAVRLDSGNTLIATGNGHSVLEVTPDKEIIWEIHQNDLPGITLAWVTTIEVLPRGTYVIGNCHAGPDNPQLIEIDPKSKKVLWTLKKHALLGNDVSNSQVVDVKGSVLR